MTKSAASASRDGPKVLLMLPMTPRHRSHWRYLAPVLSCAFGIPAASAEEPPAAGASVPVEMSPVHVNAPAYKAVVSSSGIGIWPVLPQVPRVNTYEMGKVVVTASRLMQPPGQVAPTTHLLTEASLRSIPATTLDSALRSVPGFSLFRRTDSFTAHPTTQGVSMRGLGPSGASRTAVLLDGVPLNDPFGGWINWSKIPRDAIGVVEMVPGGGSAAWGNSALGGAVQVLTRNPTTEFVIVDKPPAPMRFGYRGTASATALVGDYGTRNLSVSATHLMKAGIIQLFAEDFATDGYSVVADEQRGTVDVAAWSRHRSMTLRWQRPLWETADVTVTLRGFDETRGNGTPYQRNGSRERFASVKLSTLQLSQAFRSTTLAYVQDQSFASTFSSISATRNVETPASDQFAVPATAAGASWTGLWSRSTARTAAGFDVRFVRGETRENYSFADGAFTRRRTAGGRQMTGGVFATHDRAILSNVRVTFGARLDRWSESDGHRFENALVDASMLKAEHYGNRAGFEISPGAGFAWNPHRGFRLHANAQHAFRRPTLNELYRPFRQGANVTEANAALDTERAATAEIGTEHRFHRTVNAEGNADRRGSAREQSQHWATLGVTAFWSELRDAVGNVTLARGPGNFPVFGALPPGGIGRQRLNLERSAVRGLELSGMWILSSTVSANAACLFTDSEVKRASVAPTLVGRRLAQVPQHTGSLMLTWKPKWLTLTTRMRRIGRQFEDDDNSLTLASVVVADVGISRPLGKHLEVFANVENAGGARIESGRSATGLVNTGTPRLATLGLRGSW